MERYPIGKQDFKSIREGGYVYIDKTSFIRRMIEGTTCYFLSRPRRFGKSLFLSTLEYFFRGEKELFKGLDIESYPWDWAPRPVIRLDFNGGNFKDPAGLPRFLNYIFSRYEKEFGLPPQVGEPESPYGQFGLEGLEVRFRNLIYEASERYGRRVVVLVDEYEKPLLDALEISGLSESYRDLLRSIYAVLKSTEDAIELAVLTGVTRFGHLNIFSGFNNLLDISLSPKYSSICGITAEELGTNFREGIGKLSESKQISPEEALELLKEYYDGYHFGPDLTDIYNPYSLMVALEESRIEDVWAYTGNSAYLLGKLKKSDFNLFNLEGEEVDKGTLIGVDDSMANPVTLLYQSGYLTIKGVGDDDNSFVVGLPNHEVKSALYKIIIPYYTGKMTPPQNKDYKMMSEWMNRGDAARFMRWLKEFFARVPNEMKLLPLADRLRQESDFQFVVFSILSLACGLDKVELEKSTSNGRIDLTVETEGYIYIFEFKIGTKAEKALSQIDKKKYSDRWASDSRKIIMIGVAFSSETRGIIDYAILT